MSNYEGLRLVDESEAAKILGIAKKTLQGWRWKGYGLPFVKIGWVVRYRLADLQVFLEEQTRKPRI